MLALPICQNQQNSKDSVVLNALLPLHSGEDCSETQIRGVQQLAALEYGLNKVNADLSQYGNVKISLQVLDTCSNWNKAVKVTMKGLVSAEQTCIPSPLFLGYVGPDDLEVFVKLQKITSLLNKTHILPYNTDLNEERPVNVFFIGRDQIGVRAKAILTMMRNLGWESFIPVIEYSIQTNNLLDSLVDLSDGRICPVGKPIVLPKSENGYSNVYKEIMGNLEDAAIDGVLLIVEKPEALRPFLKILSDSANVQKPFVVYIIFVGLKLWELPKSDSLKMVVMQEATEFKSRNYIKPYFNDSLLASYHEQTRMHKRDCYNDPMCMDSLEDELDSTVMPISYSVHLFANALKMSLDQKCKSNAGTTGVCHDLQFMPAAEWISLLRTASTIINGPDGPKRIRFQMETTHHVSVYMWNTITKQFELISTMTNGERLNFIKNVFLPVAIRTDRPHRPSACDHSYKVKSKPPKSPTTAASTTVTAVANEDVDGGGGSGGDDDWSPIWEFLPNSEKHPKIKDTYQSVAVILFVGVAFLIFMMVTMRMLYNVFKFKQGDDDQQSSKNRKKSSSRRPRRTGSAVSRRASRASSITSARSN